MTAVGDVGELSVTYGELCDSEARIIRWLTVMRIL